MDLRLDPGLAERRQVLPGIAVEHQFVVDDGVDLARIVLQVREPVFRHAQGEIFGSVYVVLKVITHRVLFMQYHSLYSYLFAAGRYDIGRTHYSAVTLQHPIRRAWTVNQAVH